VAGKGLATAVAVGIVEEVLFRGALFHYLLRRASCPLAVGLTSLLFAVVHFFRSGSITVDRYSLFLGPLAAWDLLYGWWEHFDVFPDLVGLMLVSVVLCWSVLLAGDIYLAIGLHTGWVFVIQCARMLFDETSGVSQLLFGGPRSYDGLVGFVLLFLIIPFLHLCVRLAWIRPARFRSGTGSGGVSLAHD
jgi:membrane protease YdiL (CAAX protease family)